jgi:hypothetical protein
MKTIFVILVSLFFYINCSAQTYITRNGRVTFLSKASVENIEAVNNEVSSVLDASKGDFVFVVLIKSFKFQKALMEEHFNEDYMESNTFPKANFKGRITDLGKINFSKDGTYPVTVKGDITIHGVTKNVEVPGTITVAQGKINAASKFDIKVRDFNIKIPTTVINNVSEIISITVDCKYDPLKKG